MWLVSVALICLIQGSTLASLQGDQVVLVTYSCINGTKCLPACTENVKISEECVCFNEVCGANHICASGIKCAQGWEQVTDLKKQIPEFLFDCLAKKDPWISPCSEFRKYFMIFDSQGNFFQEKTNVRDNTKYLSSSKKRARKPMDSQMMNTEGHPNYLFQLEDVGQNSETFYIATKSTTNDTRSGLLLIAGNEVNPSLHLREDHCGKDSRSPVAIANSTTESPVTAIAISTPGPNMGYACHQAQWRLWKVDKRFLLVESVDKPGFFLNVDSDTHLVSLGEPEKLTGIYTSFISHMTLDRSEALAQAEAGIGAEAYGDVVVHYFERDGSQQSGYICDYEWGKDSADSVCKHLGFATGIPTYNGRYSNITTPEYAVSQVKCQSENLEECKIRTVCGASSSCLTQNSMKAFGGKGYACNSGSATDVAGVVCGSEAQIFNVLKQDINCDRKTKESDKESVAAAFSVQKQIQSVSSSEFENKHWSEYLLPMPMAVSLMSALLLVSSQNDREIELVRPVQGNWVHLKHIYLQPNLLLLSQHIHDNFKLSNVNMGVIKVNTREITKDLKKAMKNAFSASQYDYKISLPRNLNKMAKNAEKNKEMSTEVCAAFSNTKEIIYEMLQALKSTQGYQQNKNKDTEKALTILNTTYVSDQEEYDKKLLEKQEYDTAVKASRKAYFDAAKNAMNAKCVEDNVGDGYGVADCNNCQWIEPFKTDRCKQNKRKDICVEWSNPDCSEQIEVCVKYKDICKTRGTRCAQYGEYCPGHRCHGQDNGCCTSSNPCVQGDGDCDSHSECGAGLYCGKDNCPWGNSDDCCVSRSGSVCDKCTKYEEYCSHSEVQCVEKAMKCKTFGESKCTKHDSICTEFVYEPAVSGSYCQDKGNGGKCTTCRWIAQVQTTLKNVGDIALKMHNSVMNDGSSYSGVAGVIEDMVAQVATIDQDVQNYKKWKSVSQHIPSFDNSAQVNKNDSQSISQSEPVVISQIDLDMDNVTKAMNKSLTTKLAIDANKNIDSMLKLTKLSVNMKTDLLSQVKIPIAKKGSHYASEVQGVLENLITRNVKKAANILEGEMIAITSLLTKGKVISMEAKKLKAKYGVEFKLPSAGADHKTGEQASILMENLTKRHKTERVIESLSNKMSNAIREMFKQNLEKQDINSIITKLAECFEYLTYLNQQWADLDMFFTKLTKFLERMHSKIAEMSDFYGHIYELNITRSELMESESYREGLIEDLLNAFSNNIFVGRIAHFYTKIAEDGLLDKMALIGLYLGKQQPERLEKIKKYIEDESVMTQEKIKLEVSKEEAKMSDKITKDVLSMKNHLACKLKDAENLADESVGAIISYQEAKNKKDNIEVNNPINSPNFEDPSPASIKLLETFTSTGKVDIGDEEYSYYD